MRISGRRFVAILLSLAGHCRKDVFQIGKLPVFTKAKRPECQNSVVLYMINTLICLRNQLFFSFLFFFGGTYQLEAMLSVEGIVGW